MRPEPRPPSRAVHIADRLVVVGLWIVAAFGAVIVVSIVVGLLRHGDSLLYGDKLEVPVQLSPNVAGRLPAGYDVVDQVRATFTISDPSTKQMLERSLQDVGPIILLLAILWQLRGFARSVVDGDPFGPANVGRLRRLGFLVLLGVPLVDLVNTWLRVTLDDLAPPINGVAVGAQGFTLSLNTLLVALALFVLAEVFAYGSALREDVEATV